MKFEKFISKRYVFSKKKLNYISIISILSSIGIMLGVASLIVVISVFNGFNSLVTSYLISFDPHIQITKLNEQANFNKINIVKVLSEIPNIKGFSPFVTGKVLVYRDGEKQVVNLKGIKGSSLEDMYNINSNILFGKGSIESKGKYANAIIGLGLADKLQALVGDTVAVISPVGIEKAITQFSMPKTKYFILTGIYNSKNNNYDANFIFTNLSTAQKLLGYYKNVEGYDIRLKNLNDLEKNIGTIKSKIDNNYFAIKTWYDFHRELYNVMQIEKLVAYLILSLIIAVSTFNILGSLTMSVIEKRRDIGILRAMGVTEKSIKKIFRYEGVIIGIIGTFYGVILGLIVSYLQIHYKIYSLDPAQYKIDALPLKLELTDFIIIIFISLGLSYIASYFPAKRAAKINALKAIKWE